MNHTLEPAAPWEQLGISEAAYRERERIASELAASQKGPGVPAAENTAQHLADIISARPGDPTGSIYDAPPAPSRKPERKTITVDLTDEPQVYVRIKQLAEADDRTLAMWLKRYLRKEHGAAVTK